MADPNVFLDNQEFGTLKTNSFNETYLYSLNRGTFDKLSAESQFAAKFKNKLFHPHTLTILIGTDSGLLPKYLIQHGLPNGSRYIFIEPANILAQLDRHQLLPDPDPAIAYISPEEWEKTAQQFKIQDYFYINSVQSVNAFCAEDDYLNNYAELSWHITETLAQQHWNYSMSLGNETFTTRQIANIADNSLPAKLLKNAFAGKTVAILAGGPSLDEALPWIQQNRAQLVIFAVSRISRQLKNINLEPDFIFSVDPTELSFDISKEMLTFSDKPIFIYSYHTIPLLVNQWQGTRFYLGPRVPWKSKLNVDNLDSTGPTVTNTALNIAHHFGFKRIILSGVDLCFTKEGYTHAKGSDEHKVGPRFNLTSLQVETNGGYMAPTSCDFAAAINTLSLQAKLISNTGTEIINLSANAARVPNIIYQPLTEVQLAEPAIPVKTIVDGCLAQQAKVADHQNTITELKRAYFQINAIKQLSENALQINQSMYSALGTINNYKDKRELDKIEKKLNREHRHYSKLVKRFGIRQFIKITQPFTDEEWSADEAQKIGAVYYQAYKNGAAGISKLLDSAIDRMQARLEENQSQPDFSLLFKQWQTDRSFGRAKLWLHKHPAVNLSAEQLDQFNDFDRQFTEVLNNQNTVHLKRAQSHSNFSQLKKRAALLLKNQKTEALQDLLSGLLKHPEQQLAAAYIALINGYLAELENNSDAAMQAYQAVIDIEDSPLLEDALLRIAAISINQDDIDNAFLAFECLAQISPMYLPFYAEINRLRGEPLAAIDSYNEYLAQFPDDHLAALKLANLYMEIKSYQAAELMVDYLLNKDRHNTGAQHLKQQLAGMAKVS
jgi:hypothetical protein